MSRFIVIDPVTKNSDFECEATSPTLAARQWLACQRTFRELRDNDPAERLDVLYVSRGGAIYAIPIARI